MSNIWVSIKESEYYQVDKSGNVRSIDRVVDCKDGDKSPRKGQRIKPTKNKFGYFLVRISLSGKGKNIFIHRLVATAFIPNPENKRCVNHKNGVKGDNRVENLEWATHSENTYHAYKVELKKRVYGNNNTASKLVLNTQTGIFYDCVNDAANAHNIKRKTLDTWLKNISHNKSNLIYA